MKLLKCHVENFGKLSNFDYTFSDGLNVFQAPNGFGKSTLAAFIKAMLYGFNKRSSQDLQKNDRKKFLPWQGGKYGGSLDFQIADTKYRVWRSFGKTAKKDAFSLYDLTHRKDSTLYSENLGEEIFQLDAESFMRSIYLPQIMRTDTSLTTSIRTKLNNLVDNTDDLNNYESAITRIETARKAYKKFRGSGGKVDEIQNQILQLEETLADLEAKKIPLEDLTQQLTDLLVLHKQYEHELSSLHQRILDTSSYERDKTIQDQLSKLKQDLSNVEADIQKIEKLYPKGLPLKEEVLQMNRNLETLHQTEDSLEHLVLNQEDIETKESGKLLFSDAEKCNKDIQTCQEKIHALVQVDAQSNPSFSKEEVLERETLNQRFMDGVPSKEEMDKWEAELQSLAQKQGALQAQELSATEAESLSKLTRFFKDKPVHEAELQRCEETINEVHALENKQKALHLSLADQKEWERLSQIFSLEVPDDEIIYQKQKACAHIDELTRKQDELAMDVQSETDKKNSLALKSLLLFGGLLLCISILCFVLAKISLGAIFVVVGFGMILCAIWMHTKQIVNQGSSKQNRSISDEQMQELYSMQKDLKAFLLKFYADASCPNEKLTQLLVDKSHYLQLETRLNEMDNERLLLEKERDAKQAFILNLYHRYYPNQPYQEHFLTDLRNNWQMVQSLHSRQKEIQVARNKLYQEIIEIESDLETVLMKYKVVEKGDLADQIQSLEEDVKTASRYNAKWAKTKENRERVHAKKQQFQCEIEAIFQSYDVYSPDETYENLLEQLREKFDAYLNASKHINEYHTKKEGLEKQAALLHQALELFMDTYALQAPLNEQKLSRILDDLTNYSFRLGQKTNLEQEIEKFKLKYPEWSGLMSDTVVSEPSLSLEELKVQEEKKMQEFKDCEKNLQVIRQKRKLLLEEVEQIPQLNDQVVYLKDKLLESQHSCEVLDTTKHFLEQAKDNLSNRYLGPVEQRFLFYVKELFGDSFHSLLVDQDLHVQIDEQGSNRKVDYFSTGTIDCIMLCMRLALMDVLFKQEKPFLLLDDPFVNLDDIHTKRVLKMLDTIAKEKQVIYMVCHSSRGKACL